MPAKYLLAAACAVALNLTTAAAFAGANEYAFEPLAAEIKKGDDVVVALRLTHKPSGKPVVDAVVSAMQSHDGRDLVEVSTRLSRRLGLPRADVEALLVKRGAAWLGTRRLLWARSDGLQWSPGDDLCMTCTLRITRGQSSLWRLDARLSEVEPL